MATMSVSGIVSGMDWESMIDEIITNAAKPAQVKVNKKTNLTNKKSLFEEMKVTMNSLQSSLSALKLPSTYKAKTIDIERLDKNTSYKGVLTATANADASVNVWEVKVNKLATAQINRSKQITDSTLTSTLNGVSGKTIYINSGGQKVGVEVKSTDTLESLKSRINTALTELDSPLYITASVVDNKLILKSDYTGKGTMTSKETVNYNYSTGINRLNNISIPSNAVDNVKITASGKSYVIHDDFEIANGNEIRWRQYDRGNEVALDDTLNVKYTMAAGDQYKNDKGVYGTSEITIENFEVKDFGTLASRAKIVDEDNNEYYYGKDFTITDNKVVWLDEDDSTTNEPSSYTVSYNKTISDSYSASGTKTSPTSTPASYTVQYTDDIVPSTSITYGRHDSSYSYVKITAGSLTTFSSMTGLDGVSSVTGASGNTYLMFDDDSEPSININGTDYVYGRDYVIRKGGSSDEMFLVPYTTYGTDINDYLNAAGKTMPSGVQISAQNDIINEVTAGTSTASLSYSHTTSIDSSDQTSITNLLNDSSTDMSKIVILKSDGTEYTEGTDYHISNGGIVWTLPNDSTDITMAQFAELQTKYSEAASSSLSTVTLIDGNNVLRTYVDPEDPSLFKMSAGGVDYEYGRDYVLRVNDAGTGYRFDWLVENSDTITDANTTVTTYAAYKNISTSSWQAAPAEDTAYSFGFDYDITTSASATVSSSATYKPLATILSGVSIDSSDYSTIQITDSAGTTYNYGIDFKIDSSGNITWLDKDSYGASYSLGSAASATVSGIPASGTLQNVSGLPTLSSMGVTTFQDGSQYYVDEAQGKAAFTLTDSSGNVYEYGKDFALRSTSTTGGTLQLVFCHYNSWPSSFSNQAKARTIPSSETLTLTYNNPVTAYSADSTSSKISDILGFTPSNYNNLTITGALGKTYSYVSSSSDLTDSTFTIDTTTGKVVFDTSSTPSRPQSGKKYTFYYDAYKAVDYSAAYTSGDDTTAVSGSLTYAQILSDTGLTSSSSDSKFADYFSLSDGTNTYTYGTDYRIIQGDSSDSAPLIKWISGGSAPSANMTLTLSYGGNGGEVLTTNGVKRSASDTLSVDYADLDSGTVTITQGSKTYYEGVDFTLSSTGDDDSGSAVVDWIPDNDGGYEWFYPNPGSTYTINHTDEDGNTTTYSATRNSGSTLNMSDYGMTTATGSVSVQYGEGVSYNLNSDATYTVNGTDYDVPSMVRSAYSVDITPTTGSSFNFRWLTPTQTTHSNLPSMNEELTVELNYDANTFDLSDDGDGDLLQALGFVDSSGSYIDYTAADDAELEIDGQTVTVDSNDIGTDYENEVIKGVTLHLKGTGTVSLDISHDAEKAVESIQTFVDNYNDLMTWINTRMTEKQVDEDTAATIDSDDFRMRWGLLHGNSLLRNTKSQMRSLVSQNFTFSFTERKSSSEVYGRMSYNGLKSSSTLRLRIGSKYVDVTIDPDDTLETIVAKINDDTKNGPMHDIYYDDDGNKLQTPLLKASVQNDKLVINSTSSDEITMSGSAAMNALKMNYSYRGLYQLGIETTSDDYGKSGELVFNTDEFMTALEDNPDEVQSLMVAFANQFNTWTRSMLNSSSSGEVSGTLTREIENIQSQIDTINEYLENYQDRLDRMEESLRTRYANTETQFSKLSQQANSIAAILNQLNGNASGGGYGQTSS